MKIVLLLLLLLVGGTLFFLNWQVGVFDYFLPSWQQTQEKDFATQVSAEFSVQELEVEVSAPPPLRAETQAPSSQLSAGGVLQWTNIHRATEGLAALEQNVLLDSIAAKKLDDMFEKQYFAHTSPSGEGIAEVTEATGYEYISIGENLALGNYENDEDLVQAWMDSPGHRANILNSRFSQIGIAVGEDVFEGRSTWLAVQVFAKPLSSCDSPSASLKTDIELKRIQIAELGAMLEQERQALDSTLPQYGQVYRQKVSDYNELVSRYNTLVRRVQELVAAYNSQVREFNECAKQ